MRLLELEVDDDNDDVDDGSGGGGGGRGGPFYNKKVFHITINLWRGSERGDIVLAPPII